MSGRPKATLKIHDLDRAPKILKDAVEFLEGNGHTPLGYTILLDIREQIMAQLKSEASK